MSGQRLCLDRISNLPPGIIETILCFLPIQDAARTSILSRNWRYNWVTIPKLEFIEDNFNITSDENWLSILEETYMPPSEQSFEPFMLHAIYPILLMHRGPIHEFTLSMELNGPRVQIDRIILHLSTNYNVKKLTLNLGGFGSSSCIFSLRQLTHLYIYNCCYDLHDLPAILNGFGSLTTLYIDYLLTTGQTLLRLISSCPLLKSLTLLLPLEMSHGHYYDVARFTFTIYNLFKCIPDIEHLTLDHSTIQCFYWDGILQDFVDDEIPRELPISLPHLKSFHLKDTDFTNKYGLPFLLLLIRCSPNLEKIKIRFGGYNHKRDLFETDFLGYSDIWLEDLNELVIENFSNLKPEMEFMKLVLAKSPVLKKMSIYHDFEVNTFDKDTKLDILEDLLLSPRASPVVDIYVTPQ